MKIIHLSSAEQVEFNTLPPVPTGGRIKSRKNEEKKPTTQTEAHCIVCHKRLTKICYDVLYFNSFWLLKPRL